MVFLSLAFCIFDSFSMRFGPSSYDAVLLSSFWRFAVLSGTCSVKASANFRFFEKAIGSFPELSHELELRSITSLAWLTLL
jgi:hypothetical protein